MVMERVYSFQRLTLTVESEVGDLSLRCIAGGFLGYIETSYN
jgi:hypothetical protein